MLRNRVTQIANLGVIGSNPIISIKHGNVLECSSIGRARMYFIRFYFLFYGDMLQFGETGRSQKPLRLMTHCEFESHYPHFFGELAQWLRQGIANPSVGVTRLASSSLALSVKYRCVVLTVAQQSPKLPEWVRILPHLFHICGKYYVNISEDLLMKRLDQTKILVRNCTSNFTNGSVSVAKLI